MFPVSRLYYEQLCAIYGDALASIYWHPAPAGWL